MNELIVMVVKRIHRINSEYYNQIITEEERDFEVNISQKQIINILLQEIGE